MNILYTILVGGWGGLEQYPFTLYPHLVKKKNKVYFLVLEKSRAHQECIKRNIPFFTLSDYKRFNPSIIKYMRKLVLDNKIDIVHINKSREIYNWSIALRRVTNVGLVMSQHIGIAKKNDILHKFFYKRLDAAIAVTKFLYHRMRARLPVSNEKIHLLYNGVDLSRFRRDIKSEIRKEFKIPKNKILFVSVGNLSPNKGVYDFIEAGKELLKKYKNIHFMWVGDDKYSGVENFYEKLNMRLNEYNIDKYFTFAGYRNDIPEILKASDVFVLPSHNETFGIVYIEAMAMAKPVIGCRAGGVSEIIDDGINGFLVPPNDSEELAMAMLNYITNRKLINQHGKNGIKMAKKFSMNNHINELLRIYNGIL